jgi:ElaB/YqjD/DUF883 family membrane-anchored ribosome-binding protein
LAFREARNGRSPTGAPGAILVSLGLSTLPSAYRVGGRCFDHCCDHEEISMTTKTGDFAASDLSADLDALRADITRLSDTMAGLLKAQANSAGAAVRGAVGDAREQLSQAANQAQDSALGAAADLERRIERNPLTAVLIAAGIGMALGMMSKSR